MICQYFDRFCGLSDIPKFSLTVVPAACQVVLFVWVEIQVPHQLTMCILYAVDLPAVKIKIVTQGISLPFAMVKL